MCWPHACWPLCSCSHHCADSCCVRSTELCVALRVLHSVTRAAFSDHTWDEGCLFRPYFNSHFTFHISQHSLVCTFAHISSRLEGHFWFFAAGQSSVMRGSHPLRGAVIRYAGQSSVTWGSRPLQRGSRPLLIIPLLLLLFISLGNCSWSQAGKFSSSTAAAPIHN